MIMQCIMKKNMFICLIAVIITIIHGCARVHFTVTSAPVPPEHAPSFKTEAAEIPVVVQITNFVINKVDTQYPESEKEVFQRHYALAIPNSLQDSLGKRQIFSRVTRVTISNPTEADYILSGNYDFFSRLGTQGREWIPFAGTVGAEINEAWVKETMHLRITHSKTGAEVFFKSFPEEHRDRTSIYKKAQVSYLQANYISAMTSEIIDVIKKQEFSRATSYPQKHQAITSTTPPSVPASGTAKIVTVTWTFANIRSGAGDNYSVVTTVKQGDKLTGIGESGEWLNVRLENGQQGWISNRVVK